MEALANYMKEMAYLPNEVLIALGRSMDLGLFDHNNAEELRLAYKEAQQIAMEKVNDRECPYYVITYPDVKYRCATCGKEVVGGYYEISNPKTHQRGMFRVRLMHELIEHGRSGYFEPIVNMSEVHITDDEHNLDFQKLKKILAGLPLPPAAQAELEAGLAGKA